MRGGRSQAELDCDYMVQPIDQDLIASYVMSLRQFDDSAIIQGYVTNSPEARRLQGAAPAIGENANAWPIPRMVGDGAMFPSNSPLHAGLLDWRLATIAPGLEQDVVAIPGAGIGREQRRIARVNLRAIVLAFFPDLGDGDQALGGRDAKRSHSRIELRHQSAARRSQGGRQR